MVGTKQSNGGTEAEKGEQRIRESVDYVWRSGRWIGAGAGASELDVRAERVRA